MQSQAFETLGIEPTIDGRAIRAAFVRLARIYHPDRFSGQPPDVRSEAERRMKEAAAAYELLRATNKTLLQGNTVFNDKDIQDRARKYREAAEARLREEERNRARWLRWEAIELAARERVEAESALAAAAMGKTDTVHVAHAASRPEPPRQLPTRTPSSGLQQRIEAARRREKEADTEKGRTETLGSAEDVRRA
jgi:curved DNA-binding protein CbpA